MCTLTGRMYADKLDDERSKFRPVNEHFCSYIQDHLPTTKWVD